MFCWFYFCLQNKHTGLPCFSLPVLKVPWDVLNKSIFSAVFTFLSKQLKKVFCPTHTGINNFNHLNLLCTSRKKPFNLNFCTLQLYLRTQYSMEIAPSDRDEIILVNNIKMICINRLVPIPLHLPCASPVTHTDLFKGNPCSIF